MAIKRRELLAFFTAAGLCAALPVRAQETADLVIGACRLNADHFGLTAIDYSGHIHWQSPLPGRGHDVALHPSQTLGVIVARRPGRWLQLFDTRTGQTLQQITAGVDITLNGHALWYGNQLFVVASGKNDSTMRLLRFTLAKQRLELQQTQSFPYIGPHELIRYDNRVHIAIGGLHTRGREVLNKMHFTSGLLTLDADNWQTQHFIASPAVHVSLRHLAANQAGQLFIAGQYQLAAQDSEPLLYAVAKNRLIPFLAEQNLWARLKGYLGSIATVDDQVIVTSPRAHWLGRFSARQRRLQHQLLSHDICALALSGQRVIAGTGTGKLWLGEQRVHSGVIWDNHFDIRSDSV